jgi:hypothetical protein
MSKRPSSTQKLGPLQIAAITLLALSLLCVMLALRANAREGDSLGPQTLGVVRDKVWIADESALLIVDGKGQPLSEHSFAGLGVESIGSIVAVPGAGVLIASRDSSTLKLLDAQDAHLLRQVELQFPASLGRSASNALWLATSPADTEGHFSLAVATGGNHAVARFDDQGRFLARSKDGLYSFTNGLWFAEDSWWTTDTNRFVLRRLQRDSLAQVDSIALSAEPSRRFLGAAIASRASVQQQGKTPVASVVRLKNNMMTGHVVEVFADGSESAYPMPDDAEPMDLAWHDTELLVIDGNQGKVLRFDQQQRALPAFGDQALLTRFARSAAQRHASHFAYQAWLAGALLCFVFAGILVVIASRKQAKQAATDIAIPASHVAPSQLDFLRVWWHCYWPGAVLWLSFIWLQLGGMRPLIQFFRAWHISPLSAALLTGAAFICIELPWLLWMLPRQRKLAEDPQNEAVLNLQGLLFLRARKAWPDLMREGEQPREVIACYLPRVAFLLLTNQRLLSFKRGIDGAHLEHSWERSEIVSAHFDDLSGLRGLARLRKLWSRGHLDIRTRDGLSLRYRVTASSVARRICALLTQCPAPAAQTACDAVANVHTGYGPGWLQILASALLPGLGQWLQRRPRSALLFFGYGAVIFSFVVLPVAWALWTRHTGVSPHTALLAAALWLAWSLGAALEACLMTPTRRARRHTAS